MNNLLPRIRKDKLFLAQIGQDGPWSLIANIDLQNVCTFIVPVPGLRVAVLQCSYIIIEPARTFTTVLQHQSIVVLFLEPVLLRK